MTKIEKLFLVAEITKDIADLMVHVTERFSGQVEIETFENIFYVICREHFRPDLKNMFEEQGLDFVIEDNGNNSAKFMIKLGDVK